MKALLHLLLFSFCIVMLAGCDKDDAASDETPRKTLDKQLLTEKPWRCEKMLVNGNDFSRFVDITTITFKFNTDGTYQNTFMDKVTNGKWELVPDKDQLKMNKGTASEMTVEVTLLSKNNLDFEFEEPDSGSRNKVRYQLVH